MSSKQCLQRLLLDVTTPDWCDSLVKDDDLEAQVNPHMDKVLMPLEVRDYFWSFTSELLRDRELHTGISSLACRLFERYCSYFVCKCDQMSPSKREFTKKQMKKRIPLIMAICIVFAYKTQYPKKAVKLQGKYLMRSLRARSYWFRLRDVIDAEIEVFLGIDCYIPLSTNWHKVQIIAREVGLAELTVQGAGVIMELIDYKLPLVREKYSNYLASLEHPKLSNEVGK